MTDEQVEKIIKRNMNLQMNLAGIRADFEEALQRQWVGLTDEQWQEIAALTGCLRIEKRGRDAIMRIFDEAAHGIKGEA